MEDRAGATRAASRRRPCPGTGGPTRCPSRCPRWQPSFSPRRGDGVDARCRRPRQHRPPLYPFRRFMRPLHLALVWHMHQPYYKDDVAGTYLLPWIRLRSNKDYRKMAALLDAYPRVRQTFNLVPSLLAQIEDYANGSFDELFLSLSQKPAAQLTSEERVFILRWMRESPRFLRVQASPRYAELAAR